jgi:hypothetical protein
MIFNGRPRRNCLYILGIKIYRDRQRRLIGLSQSTYLDKVLKRFRIDKAKKGFLPMLSGKILSKAQCPATAKDREAMRSVPYSSAIGSIMYAMLCTRPDVSNALSLARRYQSDPGVEYWTAIKNILKYLYRIKEMFLIYGGDEELVIKGYADVSFNIDPEDSNSQSGYDYIVDGDLKICKVHTDLNVADPLTNLFHEQNMISTLMPWVLDCYQT